MEEGYGLALGMAQRNRNTQQKAKGWMQRAVNAEERMAQLELELKVEICSHAGTVAQNEALRDVLSGKITKESLNKVVGRFRDGDPLYVWNRIFRRAFIAKAAEVGLESPERHLHEVA